MNYACIPTLEAIKINTDTTANTATIIVNKAIPFGDFLVKINPCHFDLCSTLELKIQSCNGDNVLNIVNRQANNALLSQLSCQTLRHGCIGLTRSCDFTSYVLWQDRAKNGITPITTTTTETAAFTADVEDVASETNVNLKVIFPKIEETE